MGEPGGSRMRVLQMYLCRRLCGCGHNGGVDLGVGLRVLVSGGYEREGAAVVVCERRSEGLAAADGVWVVAADMTAWRGALVGAKDASEETVGALQGNALAGIRLLGGGSRCGERVRRASA